MRLHVTDHSLVRMADWHPEFKQFVPSAILLGFPGAQGVMNALHIFLASLENGRPATKCERRMEKQSLKYRNVRQGWVFDRALFDLYTIVLEPRPAIVTVTAVKPRDAIRILDDPSPPIRFSDVTELELPYLLEGSFQDDPEFRSIRTPAGRELGLVWNGKLPAPTKSPGAAPALARRS